MYMHMLCEYTCVCVYGWKGVGGVVVVEEGERENIMCVHVCGCVHVKLKSLPSENRCQTANI